MTVSDILELNAKMTDDMAWLSFFSRDAGPRIFIMRIVICAHKQG